MTEYAHPELLVETGWLADNLANTDPLRVIEVDEDTTAYEQGHIRNALAWNWFEDLHAKPRREYVDQEQLTELLRAAGVGSDTAVILYGGNNNWFAAYAYWLLRYRGFDNARLLNGGRKKWELEGRELVTGVPSFQRTDITVKGPDHEELRAMREYVLAKVQAGTTRFVDVRSPEEYRGELLAPPHLPQEQAQVPGHIPRAANIPWSKATNDDGTFKSVDDLQALYGGEGITSDADVIAYCRIGERSAHTWFVLHELLGYRDVRNYDGSWTEYGSLVNVPVER